MVRVAGDVPMRGAGTVVAGARAVAATITITMGSEGSRSLQNERRGVMGKGGCSRVLTTSKGLMMTHLLPTTFLLGGRKTVCHMPTWSRVAISRSMASFQRG